MTSLGATLRRVEAQYSASYPPDVFAPAVPATGATAGIPGSWTPSGSTPPASLTALQSGTPVPVTASPATAWTSGQFVQTRTAGAAGRATWTGSGWVGGAAPLEDPGAFTVAELEAWVEENPDQAAALLDAEQARGDAARVTLVAWLESHQEQT